MGQIVATTLVGTIRQPLIGVRRESGQPRNSPPEDDSSEVTHWDPSDQGVGLGPVLALGTASIALYDRDVEAGERPLRAHPRCRMAERNHLIGA